MIVRASAARLPLASESAHLEKLRQDACAGTVGALIVRARAELLPLANGSVQLVVFSPPYWALRSYRDAGEHYEGQIGSESHPRLWLEAMWDVMVEIWRVLAPDGSVWVNLGDKRSGSSGHNNSGLPGTTSQLHPKALQSATALGEAREEERAAKRDGISSKSTLRGNGHVGGVNGKGVPNKIKATRRNAPDRYNQAAFGRPKSKMLLPHRFAIGCEDGLADCQLDHHHEPAHWLTAFRHGIAVDAEGVWHPEPCQGVGWIVRQDEVIYKKNSLPESVDDRTRDSHEYFFHLTKSGDYYSAVDEIREGYAPGTSERYRSGYRPTSANAAGIASALAMRSVQAGDGGPSETNPLGKLPGSVWEVSSEPLQIPEWATKKFNLPQHFAAFIGGTELVRRIILGWSPPAICLTCGEGRRPAVAKRNVVDHETPNSGSRKRDLAEPESNGRGINAAGAPVKRTEATILGYACSCCPSHTETVTTLKHDPDLETCDGQVQVPTGEEDIFGDPRMEWQDCTDPAHMVSETKNEKVYDLDGWVPPRSRPAVVLDPFSGTGTTALVAKALGRAGIGIDLSADYCRLAQWRCGEASQARKATQRTWSEAQGTLLGESQ